MSGCSNTEQYDQKLQPEAKTAKQLYAIAIQQLNTDKNREKYSNLVPGEIRMDLDKEQQGKVAITFVEVFKSNPRVVSASFDTKAYLFEQIKYVGKDNKLNPGIINFNDWVIDSDKAVEIAKQVFSGDANFHYDMIDILGYNLGVLEQDQWWVSFRDMATNESYDVWINPYMAK